MGVIRLMGQSSLRPCAKVTRFICDSTAFQIKLPEAYFFNVDKNCFIDLFCTSFSFGVAPAPDK